MLFRSIILILLMCYNRHKSKCVISTTEELLLVHDEYFITIISKGLKYNYCYIAVLHNLVHQLS